MNEWVTSYASTVIELSTSRTTIESTYYPAIADLISRSLRERKLPFQVRTTTSERRQTGGRDQPDLALYDGAGNFIVVCCEVKTPDVELEELALSVERNNQIGRYLALTGAVVVCNVRSFGIVTVAPSAPRSVPVPPALRRLEHVATLWSSASALRGGHPLRAESPNELGEVLEIAVTQYAPIAEPQSLARILARQARKAKQGLPPRFTEAVQNLLEDFGSALGITFDGKEGEEFFRSSLIQTVYYGVFAGWLLWQHDRPANATDQFAWERVPEYLQIPFIGGLFHELQNPTRIRELGLRAHLETAAETFARIDKGLFLERLRFPNLMDEDEHSTAYAAIMYFYEPFLEAFDPELRKELGVWYTPPEIVRYQVERVDELLKTSLRCPRGLADENVVILDPCCGTGAYLVEVLRVVARQLRSEGIGPMMGEHLLRAVTTRIVGFEILTAPFVIAHLQMYLLLSRLGVQPEGTTRAAIFLTNALTGWGGLEHPRLHFPELQLEHDAARSQKEDARIVVVIGNPPYNRFAGVPMKEEVALADVYKGISRNSIGRQVGATALYSLWGIRKHLLDDLYIRFFRLAEECIGERAEYGVVSYISNNSFLNGRSHPIMRESLLNNFNTIWIDNLHGNRLASERTPSGDSCETIFNVAGVGSGIKVGTAISTFLKERGHQQNTTPATVMIRDFWGRASDKRRGLLSSITFSAQITDSDAPAHSSSIEYEQISPTRNGHWKFTRAGSDAGGYESWIGLDELFPTNFQGVNPNRGLSGSVIDIDADQLRRRMELYFSDTSFEDFAVEAPTLCEARASYMPEDVRVRLNRLGYNTSKILPYLLFPFDQRWIYYETFGNLLNRSRPELLACLPENEFLIAVPQPRRYSETRPMISRVAFDLHVHDRGAVGFAAHVVDGDSLFAGLESALNRRKANLMPGLAEHLGRSWNRSLEPLLLSGQLMRHCLTICHSPQYELDNKDQLAQDWARVPLPRDHDAFAESVLLGEQLRRLMDTSMPVTDIITSLLGPHYPSVGRVEAIGGGPVRARDLVVTYSYYGGAKGRWESRGAQTNELFFENWGEETGDLYLNPSICVRNVPERIWSYEIGGYPVIKKWLGYRDRGRRPNTPLSLSEVDTLTSIIRRVAAVHLLHARLDRSYESCLQDVITREHFLIERRHH